MLTETPKRSCASTLSPSVTATSRMLSPNRASFSVRTSASPCAARTQVPIRPATLGSLTCPATVLRGTPSRVCTNPNSRSPCAAWFRFMKSMSIVDHGSATFACVCRCSSGLRSASSPDIHIFAGEKVCIHAIRPTQLSSPFASRHSRRIAAASVSTGFQTSSTGPVEPSAPSPSAAESCSAIARDWSATCRSVSSP